jgi:septal ring factor EnvC (AmiA/AmiB activator)
MRAARLAGRSPAREDEPSEPFGKAPGWPPRDCHRPATRHAVPLRRGLRLVAGALAAGLWVSAPAPPATAAQEPAPDQPSALAGAAERARLAQQAARARDRRKALAAEAARLAAARETLLGRLRRLEIEREEQEAREQEAVAGERLARAALDETARRLAALEAEVAATRPKLRARLRRLYMMGPLDSPRWWLRADDVRAAGRAWRILSMLADRDRAALDRAASAIQALAQVRAEQEAHAREAAAQAELARAARQAAAEAAARQRALVARLEGEQALAEQLAAELAGAEAALRAALEQAASGAAPPPVVVPIAPFRGDLDWPVPGQLVSRFGRSRQSRFGTVLPRTGVEIAAPEGAPVRAIHDGRVAFADTFTGYGRLVIVDHGGDAFSLYGYLRDLTVGRGAAVTRGTPVGHVGRTPSGSPALYFELRIDGRPVDPLEWMASAATMRPRSWTPRP